MIRQIIAVLTLASYVIFSASCVNPKEINLASPEPSEAKQADLHRAEKTAGKPIVLNEDQTITIGTNSHHDRGTTESLGITKYINSTELKPIACQRALENKIGMESGATIPMRKSAQEPETIAARIREDVRPYRFGSISFDRSIIGKKRPEALDAKKLLILVVVAVVIISLAYLAACNLIKKSFVVH